MFEEPLRDIEVRVLGCLIEKEMTTPESYPMSVNSLVIACNQKSNRSPIMTMTDEDVTRALNRLRYMQMTVVSSEGGRVPRYRHILAENVRLVPAELAVISELLVRGPQTAGELRTRCERMCPFPDLAAMEDVLKELTERNRPLVTSLPRQPGRKEVRHAHLFSGKPIISDEEQQVAPEPARRRVMVENERIAQLEAEVAALRGEIATLRRTAEDFRNRF